MPWLAPLIAAAGSLAGAGVSALSQGANSAAARQTGWDQFNQNYQNQKEFAQHGIRWKVEDAKAAGIHPLFALGGSTASYSPSTFSVGGGGSDPGDYLSSMGQNISRAVQATRTAPERALTNQELQMNEEKLTGARLNNDLTRLQIQAAQTRLANQQVGPPFPQTGPGNPISNQFGTFESKPTEVMTAQPGSPPVGAGSPGPTTNFNWGGKGLVPSPAKGSGLDEVEMENPLAWMWSVKNLIAPNIFSEPAVKPTLAQMQSRYPNATGVFFDIDRQEWMPLFNNQRDFFGKIHHGLSQYGAWRNRVLFNSPPPRGASTWSGGP